MRAIRIVAALIASAAGFLYALIAYGFIGWGWSDSGGHWGTAQWVLTLVPGSVPFLFATWMVYRCCESKLGQTLMAEAGGLGIVFLLGAGYWYETRDFPVLVEHRPPLQETRDPGYRPRLPLTQPAVGIEGTDGKFVPTLFLDWPPPGWGFQDLTFDLSAGTPEIKIYRGTNEIAASNHYLGRFQIIDYPKSKQSLDVLLIFELSDRRELLLIARERDRKTHLKLHRVDAVSRQQ